MATYGVGPSTAGPNWGVKTGAVSVMDATGKVVDKTGDTVFDPSEDAVALVDPS